MRQARSQRGDCARSWSSGSSLRSGAFDPERTVGFAISLPVYPVAPWMRMVPFKWPRSFGRPSSELQPRERLFVEAGVGGFPMQRAATNDTALSERHYRARGATTLDSSPAARAGQHVATLTSSQRIKLAWMAFSRSNIVIGSWT
jgi:hypothetical protein